MNPAAKCRAEKDLHPERYCVVPGCLWKVRTSTGAKPCKKHFRLYNYTRYTIDGASLPTPNDRHPSHPLTQTEPPSGEK